jgi:hypothetical protein
LIIFNWLGKLHRQLVVYPWSLFHMQW